MMSKEGWVLWNVEKEHIKKVGEKWTQIIINWSDCFLFWILKDTIIIIIIILK